MTRGERIERRRIQANPTPFLRAVWAVVDRDRAALLRSLATKLYRPPRPRLRVRKGRPTRVVFR